MHEEHTPDTNEAIWYEAYPKLNRALMMVKNLDNEQQELVGKRIYDYAKELFYTHPDPSKASGVSQGNGLERLQKLLQNKQFHSQIGRGLNEILNLNEEGRELVGQRFLLCLQALDGLQHSRGNDSSLSDSQKRLQVYTLIQSVFEQDIKVFEAQGVAKKQEKIEKQLAEENQRLLEETLSQMLEEGLDVEMLHHKTSLADEPHQSFFITDTKFWGSHPVLYLTGVVN
ncbi:MAG: hypothetical protein ACKO34_09105 [Vampirovibrionales bacterium]